MKKMKLGLLPRIIIAIALGIVCGLFFPGWIVRIFLTVNSLFGNFLNFIIPLLILGLVAPGIADLGKGAGRLLLITALLAYGFTLFSGFFTYFTCDLSYPWLLNTSDKLSAVADNTVMNVFLKIIVVIFVMTVVLLFIQFFIAGMVGKKNPLRLFRNMLPAYMTALGTQSSAATIPVTLEQTIRNGVRPDLAGFVIPLCATIHLSGSTMKIVACSMAIMLMSGMEINFAQFAGFIMMLGIAMVAAPGVPGGAIMAALGLLQSMLGFDETAQGLMIALYIAMDSFGTATNVTGDGAIAVIVDRINSGK